MIQFENVSKHYRKGNQVIRALDDVSFTIDTGKLTLMRGPSGSGKTTIINLAAGLCRQTKGSVTVDSVSLDNLSHAERAQRRATDVAVVFQMFHLVPYLTALENVLLPTLAVACDDAGDRAKGLLDDLGLVDRLGHYPDELSAGERQRCALARALFHDPSVILADEPTGNLDPKSARKVVAKLDAARQRGATILLVSHQPIDDIHPDIIYTLEEGKLTD